MTTLQIRHEGPNVTVIKDGVCVFDMPYQAALELAAAIHIQAKLAEEIANREQLTTDQAILVRNGIPLGLITDKRLRHEALEKAQYDPKLRRYIPMNIANEPIVGAPTLIQRKPNA